MMDTSIDPSTTWHSWAKKFTWTLSVFSQMIVKKITSPSFRLFALICSCRRESLKRPMENVARKSPIRERESRPPSLVFFTVSSSPRVKVDDSTWKYPINDGRILSYAVKYDLFKQMQSNVSYDVLSEKQKPVKKTDVINITDVWLCYIIYCHDLTSNFLW